MYTVHCVWHYMHPPLLLLHCLDLDLYTFFKHIKIFKGAFRKHLKVVSMDSSVLGH